jgi:hypothetical protein
MYCIAQEKMERQTRFGKTKLKLVLCKFYVVCTLHFILSFSQNQQMHKIINKYKIYLQPLHMFQDMNCHSQGVFIKKLQVLTASKYTICGFTVDVFTYVTI